MVCLCISCVQVSCIVCCRLACESSDPAVLDAIVGDGLIPALLIFLQWSDFTLDLTRVKRTAWQIVNIGERMTAIQAAIVSAMSGSLSITQLCVLLCVRLCVLRDSRQSSLSS
jgi:hypothetical protein